MATGNPVPVTTTAIFGGCVSRDTLAFAGDEAYPLARYIARHSLLSAGTDASQNFPEFEVTSAFQRRMIEFDIKGELIQDVSKLRNVDVFLWDLNVERSGCWQFPDRSIVTNSSDLRRVPELKQALGKAQKIGFGAEEHKRRWWSAANIFVDALDELDLKQRTLVLAPEWALIDTNGEPTRKVGSLDPEDAAATFAPYVDHLEGLGLTVARFNGLVSDLNHRWGRAPFHYTPDAYDRFRECIDQFVEETRSL